MHRIEDKIPLNGLEILKVKSLLEENNAKILYPRRLIKSIYCDDFRLSMFIESEEGISPRKKIRIRSYNDNLKDIFLETKVTSPEGRYKISKRISEQKKNFFLKNGLFDLRYGQCLPTTEIFYLRDYLTCRNVRITIDSSIKYRQYGRKGFISSEKNVLEFKPTNPKDLQSIEKILLGRKSRFSKYVLSILDSQIAEKRSSIFLK